jgi:hypothetical protein
VMTCIKDQGLVAGGFVVRRISTAQLSPAEHSHLEASGCVVRLALSTGQPTSTSSLVWTVKGASLRPTRVSAATASRDCTQPPMA